MCLFAYHGRLGGSASFYDGQLRGGDEGGGRSSDNSLVGGTFFSSKCMGPVVSVMIEGCVGWFGCRWLLDGPFDPYDNHLWPFEHN